MLFRSTKMIKWAQHISLIMNISFNNNTPEAIMPTTVIIKINSLQFENIL